MAGRRGEEMVHLELLEGLVGDGASMLHVIGPTEEVRGVAGLEGGQVKFPARRTERSDQSGRRGS
jgi:hypothetical protein